MATKKPAAKKEELFDVTLPRSMRAYKDEEAMYLCVNGETKRVMYGKTVKLPKRFVSVIRRNIAGKDRVEDYIRAHKFGAEKK